MTLRNSGPVYRCGDPDCGECNRTFGRGTPYGTTKRLGDNTMPGPYRYTDEELAAILAKYEVEESYGSVSMSVAVLRALVWQAREGVTAINRALLEQAYGHIAAAEVQLAPSDDQIIAGHIRGAKVLLERAMRAEAAR
jgi:hypothetical protein